MVNEKEVSRCETFYPRFYTQRVKVLGKIENNSPNSRFVLK